MSRLYFLLLLMFLTALRAEEYQLGRGHEFYAHEGLSLTLGAHMDINFHGSNRQDESVQLGQAGIMLFGEYTPKFHFLAEIGSDDTYTYSLTHDNSASTALQLMRLYGEYSFSDAIEVKFGQFLTPIGIWNRTYIPALRWSAFTPYVAQGFFPKIIAGASINGRLCDNRELSYSLFYHVDGEHDTNQNNVKAKEFIGGELRYHFSPLIKLAFPFGRYRSDSSQEINLFTGLNLLLPFKKNEFSSEFIYKDGEWTDANGYTNTWKSSAWYLQYVQHIYKSSYLSARYGEKRRFQSKNGINWSDKNTVFGYIYRPKTAFSTKLEYRHTRRSGLDTLGQDEVLLSFSVLF